MRKLGRASIQCVLDRAIKEFWDDASSPYTVSFFWKGHFVEAEVAWSQSRCSYYISRFNVVYPRAIMQYFCGIDYDISSAWCE